MDSFGRWLVPLAIFLVPVLLAISLHEAAHAYVARFFGDTTASDLGRVSLNPLRHIDPVGTVLLPLVAYWTIGLPFGYARPVPYDPDRLRKPRLHAALVAFAGPAANLLLGLGWALLGVLLQLGGHHSWSAQQLVTAGVFVNAAMFVFNMIPVPPLDGGEILLRALPQRLARQFERLRVPPLDARRLIRLLRVVLPQRLAGRVAALQAFDVCVFLVFLLLLKYRVLDGFLIKSVKTVTALFTAIVSPLYKLAS